MTSPDAGNERVPKKEEPPAIRSLGRRRSGVIGGVIFDK
jgi:hypothetical protein